MYFIKKKIFKRSNKRLYFFLFYLLLICILLKNIILVAKGRRSWLKAVVSVPTVLYLNDNWRKLYIFPLNIWIGSKSLFQCAINWRRYFALCFWERIINKDLRTISEARERNNKFIILTHMLWLRVRIFQFVLVLGAFTLFSLLPQTFSIPIY